MDQRLLNVCGTTDPLALLLSSGGVLRYHQDGQPQPVSEHTWRVLVILLHFWPSASREVILATLYHDVAERYTGDLPAPVKQFSPQIAKAVEELELEFHEHLGVPSTLELSPVDQARISVADRLELCITCKDRYSRRARQVFKMGMLLVKQRLDLLPLADQEVIHRFIEELESGTWES